MLLCLYPATAIPLSLLLVDQLLLFALVVLVAFSWWHVTQSVLWIFLLGLILYFCWFWCMASSLYLYTLLESCWLHFLSRKFRYYQDSWFGQLTYLQHCGSLGVLPVWNLRLSSAVLLVAITLSHSGFTSC